MESTTLQEEASLLLASVECFAATLRLGAACVVNMWHFVSCPFRVCSSCLFYGVLLGGLDPRHQTKRGPRSLASIRAVVFASIFELAFIVGYFCFDQRVIRGLLDEVLFSVSWTVLLLRMSPEWCGGRRLVSVARNGVMGSLRIHVVAQGSAIEFRFNWLNRGATCAF